MASLRRSVHQASADDGGGSTGSRRRRLVSLLGCLAFMAALPAAASAQIVHEDNVTIHNALCAGFDCANTEAYGSDSLRLKENNLRIHFDDTSVAPFPGNDWRLFVNDQSSGGANRFSIEDSTAGRLPFTLLAGAPSNSLFVGSQGNVGYGTANPVLDQHISVTDTPAIRLEQTSAGGFSPETWDIAGNESSFFIRDATNGSRLPFRIRPGAPSSSIDIAANGGVGMGTASPAAPLHVTRSDGSAQITVQETSPSGSNTALFDMINNNAQIKMRYTDNSVTPVNRWTTGPNGADEFIITKSGTTPGRFKLTPGGDLTVAGTLNQGSDRRRKQDIDRVDPDSILERVDELPVSTWSYKDDADGSTHLGPMSQDFYDAFGLGENNRFISLGDLGGVSLASIQALSAQLKQTRSELSEARAANDELRDRVSALEQAVLGDG